MFTLPEKRFYRAFQKPKGFKAFNVVAGESDLWIAVPETEYREEIKKEILSTLISIREQIKTFGERNPEFLKSLTPVNLPAFVPEVVRVMGEASKRVGVGPMAGVAGAVNLFIGRKLTELGFSQFIIENGGDLYINVERSVVVSLFPKNPKLLGKLGLELPPGEWGISTSSSRIGHSLSLGRTELATIVGNDPVVTDCGATYLGNSKTVVEAKKRAEELLKINTGAVALIEGKFVMAGELKLVRLTQK